MPIESRASDYYVDPAGRGLGQGLAGLGEIIARNREKKDAEAEKEAKAEQMAQAQQEIRDAIKSGDPAKIADVSIQYPAFRESIESAMSIGGDMRDTQMEDEKRYYQEVLTDRLHAGSAALRRINRLEDSGRDATQTQMFLDEFNDPETHDESLKTIESLYALRYPEEFKEYQSIYAPSGQDDPAAFRTLSLRAEAAGLEEGTPEYEAFMLDAQGDPAALETLKGRAEAAGLEPGTAEYQTFMRYGGAKPAGPAASQRDKVIQSYQDLFGMTEEEATRRYDARPMMDDKGNLITYDPISGTGELVSVDRGAPPELINAPKGTAIEDLAFDPGEGTGFAASFIGLWNSTFAQLPFLPLGKDTAEAAQMLRILERDAISALASSGRPPVVEQERIIAIMPQAMDWFQHPEEARYKMTNFVDLMMNQYVDDMRYSSDRNNPRGVREDSAGRARRIESIIRRVLEPEAARAMFESLESSEQETTDVRTLPLDELESLDPNDLTDSQIDIYIERLRDATSNNPQ